MATILVDSEAVVAAAEVATALARQEHTALSVATFMAAGKCGQAVGCLVGLSKAFYSDEQLWRAFKDYQGPRGKTRLMHAANVGNVARARFLLDMGANVNAARTDTGMTALIGASFNGFLGIAQLLVERGANVNAAKTDNGYTALMLASKKGHLETVRFLLSRGASKAALNSAGDTAYALSKAHPAIRALLRPW